MPTLTYIQPDGAARAVTAKVGETVMHVAVMNDVRGIDGECGGCLSCATCHIYVDAAWLARLPSPDDMEHELLSSVASERRPESRLSCQIPVTAGLDGLVVTVPARQS